MTFEQFVFAAIIGLSIFFSGHVPCKLSGKGGGGGVKIGS